MEKIAPGQELEVVVGLWLWDKCLVFKTPILSGIHDLILDGVEGIRIMSSVLTVKNIALPDVMKTAS